MPRRSPTPGKPPDRGVLHEAALLHLSRYAATEKGLVRVLHRRVDRWARASAEADCADPERIAGTVSAARKDAALVVAALVASGVVDDAAFAASRARSLSRAGRSRRAIGAHLSTKGVAADASSRALPANAEHELAAALVHARKRRLGPFRKSEPSPELRRKELGSLARAGFDGATASRVLAMDAEEAEGRIIAFRSEI